MRNKTGFFHVEQINGKYWLIDPAGKPFFAVGTNRFHYPRVPIKPGVHVFQDDVLKKYPSENLWTRHIILRLKSWNFNTMAMGGGYEEFKKYPGMPKTLFLWASHPFARKTKYLRSPGVPGWTTFVDIFDPAFARNYHKICSKTLPKLKKEKEVIGYYTDNELFWGFGLYSPNSLLDAALFQDKSTYNKRELIRFIKERYRSDLSLLNKNWGLRLRKWADLLDVKELKTFNHEVESDKRAFLYHYARHYFKTTSSIIRKYDPNHLILGCRIHGYCEPEVARAMGEFVDVISYNKYDGIAPVYQMEEMMFREARRPVIISEWGFRAMDSGLPNTGGVGRIMPNQDRRGRKYSDFLLGSAHLSCCVGTIFYSYVDDPSQGGGGMMHNENSNYGLVNGHDKPYAAMIAHVKNANRSATKVHGSSDTSSKTFIYNTPKDFHREPVSAFFIQRNGLMTNQQYLRAFIRSKDAGIDSQFPVFSMDFDKKIRFSAHVYQVENSALLEFWIDGKKKTSYPLPADIGKGITWIKMKDGWQSIYDKDFGVDVAAGNHSVEVRNAGAKKSWIWLDAYKIKG